MSHHCGNHLCPGDHAHFDDGLTAHGFGAGPRRVPFLDAVTIDSARRHLMARAGDPLPEAETPEMTIREETLPDGAHPLHIVSLIVQFEGNNAPHRAHLTSLLRELTFISNLKPERDRAKNHWSYELLIYTTIGFQQMVSLWRAAAKSAGVRYARLDGLFEKGIWLIENRPEGEALDYRFVVSGPC